MCWLISASDNITASPPPAMLREVLSSLGNSSYSYSIILCLKVSGDFTKDRKMSDQESSISIREGGKLRHSKTWMHVDIKKNQLRNRKLGFFMATNVHVRSPEERTTEYPQ